MYDPLFDEKYMARERACPEWHRCSPPRGCPFSAEGLPPVRGEIPLPNMEGQELYHRVYTANGYFSHWLYYVAVLIPHIGKLMWVHPLTKLGYLPPV